MKVKWLVFAAVSFMVVIACAGIALIGGYRFTHSRGATPGSVDAEVWAVASCRAYIVGQMGYHDKDRDGDGELEYANPYTVMAKTGTEGSRYNLISASFASARGAAGKPENGYVFMDMKSIAGKPIDWKSSFALCATPKIYGKTGVNTFMVTSGYMIWKKNLGCSKFVEDVPADPAAEGWDLVK